MKKEDLAKKIVFSKGELIREHKKLVSDLRSGSKEKLKKEAQKQGRELQQYKRK